MFHDDNSSGLAPVAGSELHQAVRCQDVTTVERLLAQGADPDEPDWTGSGDAPLLHAAANGNVQVVRCVNVYLGWGG
jgi:ankyrin repeat protein